MRLLTLTPNFRRLRQASRSHRDRNRFACGSMCAYAQPVSRAPASASSQRSHSRRRAQTRRDARMKREDGEKRRSCAFGCGSQVILCKLCYICQQHRRNSKPPRHASRSSSAFVAFEHLCRSLSLKMGLFFNSIHGYVLEPESFLLTSSPDAGVRDAEARRYASTGRKGVRVGEVPRRLAPAQGARRPADGLGRVHPLQRSKL